MLAYVPEELEPAPALVVALHRCTQIADAFDQGTGWSTLPDRLDFVVICPEQQPITIPRIASHGFCQEIRRAIAARRCPSGK
jgi:poly(3-hydroxybutyrate) depolymerase